MGLRTETSYDESLDGVLTTEHTEYIYTSPLHSGAWLFKYPSSSTTCTDALPFSIPPLSTCSLQVNGGQKKAQGGKKKSYKWKETHCKPQKVIISITSYSLICTHTKKKFCYRHGYSRQNFHFWRSARLMPFHYWCRGWVPVNDCLRIKEREQESRREGKRDGEKGRKGERGGM